MHFCTRPQEIVVYRQNLRDAMAFSNKVYKIKSLNNERQEEKTVVSSLNLELQIKIVLKFILKTVSTAIAIMVSEFQ